MQDAVTEHVRAAPERAADHANRISWAALGRARGRTDRQNMRRSLQNIATIVETAD
jgi:hypothetical protein